MIRPNYKTVDPRFKEPRRRPPFPTSTPDGRYQIAIRSPKRYVYPYAQPR